jgi:hypothetical protein
MVVRPETSKRCGAGHSRLAFSRLAEPLQSIDGG